MEPPVVLRHFIYGYEMKPQFSTLISLTLLMAVILLPFAFSAFYIPLMRDFAFDFLEATRSDLYKMITGFIALAFVLFEMILTVRKRGRRWRISIPGSMMLWRTLHIFLGVALVAVILIHTSGVTGHNFNAIFLWVFFATSLSALIGVVAETGVLESSRKYFGFIPPQMEAMPFGAALKSLPTTTKGPLIRGLRLFWLSTHIILVSIFMVMLVFHIFLAFYFQ